MVVVSSAATSAAAAIPLSEKAVDLKSYIRAHKSIFYPGKGFLAMASALTRKNDTGRCMIPSVELETNAHILPGRTAAEYLLNSREELVSAAIAEVGADKGSQAEEIVIYDMNYVLRVTSYAVAVGSVNFIDANNLGMMRELHKEVGINEKRFSKAIVNIGEKVAAVMDDKSVGDKTKECFVTIADALRS